MGSQTMGRAWVAATIENLYDLERVSQGSLAPGQARRVEVPAVVKTAADAE